MQNKDALYLTFCASLNAMTNLFVKQDMPTSDMFAAMMGFIGYGIGNHPANTVAMIEQHSASIGESVKKIALEARAQRRAEGRGL